MATYKTVTVKSSGGTYTNLNAVDAGEATNLVTAGGDLVVDVYNFEDTTAAVFDGAWTTDATHRVVIRAVDDHEGKWSTGAYRLTNSSTSPLTNKSIDYLFLDGIQIQSTSTGGLLGGYYAHGDLNAAGVTEMDRCIQVGPDGGTTSIGVWNGEPLHDIEIRNSVVYGWYRGLGSTGTGSKIESDNVTIDDCDIGVRVNYGGHVLTNTRITNCTTPIATGEGNIDSASDYNLTDDATAPTNWGSNSLDTATVDYVDGSNGTLTSRDYHLGATDDGIGAGDDLSSSFTTDIDGDTRSSWDIGADEYGTGDATVSPNDSTHAHSADNVTVSVLNLPTDLTAVSASLSSIDITWTDTNAAGKQYRVYWHADGDTLWNLDGQVAAGSESYTIEWLDEGAYLIGISAFDATEETAMATVQGMTVVTLLPAESTHAHTADNVTVTTTGTSIVPADAAHGHTADNATVDVTTVSVVVQDATHAHAADYVSVFDEDVFTPPSGLVLTVTADRINATWTDTNAGAFPYRVYYLRTGLDSAFTFDSETSAGAESASVKYLATGTEYTIKVAPYDTPTLGPGAEDNATTGSLLRFSFR